MVTSSHCLSYIIRLFVHIIAASIAPKVFGGTYRVYFICRATVLMYACDRIDVA